MVVDLHAVYHAFFADDGNAVTDFLSSREGRATVNNVVRGVFSLLKGKK